VHQKKGPKKKRPTKDPITLGDVIEVKVKEKKPKPKVDDLSPPKKTGKKKNLLDKPLAGQPIAFTKQRYKKDTVQEIIPKNRGTDEVVERRGKERATPKPKKLSKLKKIILQEREDKYREWQVQIGEILNQEELVPKPDEKRSLSNCNMKSGKKFPNFQTKD